MAKASEPRRRTLIKFYEGVDEAIVVTCNKKLINRMERYGIDPIESTEEGEFTYEVPKNFIRVQQPAQREYTDEMRDAARERLALAREERMASLKKAKKLAAKKGEVPAVAAKKSSLKAKAVAADDDDDEDEDEEEEIPTRKVTAKSTTKAATKNGRRTAAVADDDEDDEDDEDEEAVEVVRRKVPAKAKAGRR